MDLLEQRAVTLREIVLPGDRDAVRKIVSSTGFFRPDEVDVAVELVDERLSRGTASGYYFVFADRGAATVGYACYGPIACTEASYDLYWIAVGRECQSHGIGQRLMAAVEGRIGAAGGKRIYIDTSGQERYAPTRSFYERSGYRCEACLRDFYAAGDDRVSYAKAVSGG
jgi:ribosomal protein S18 acetylase RimI-like enzyme